MSLDFTIPTGGGAYVLPGPDTLDFWIRDLTPGAPVVTPATFEVSELASIGTVVGTVEAIDPDEDEITFSISSGNTGGAFAIDAETGVITVANGLDYETKTSYALVILATDSGGLWGTGTVTIDILDEVDVFLPPAPALILPVTTPWGGATQALDAPAELPWQAALPLDVARLAAWLRAQRRDRDTALPWGALRRRDAGTVMHWARSAQALDDETLLPWGALDALDTGAALPWAKTTAAADRGLDVRWRNLGVADQPVTVLFADPDPHPQIGGWFEPPQTVREGADIELRWSRPGLDFHVRLTDAYTLLGATLDFTVPVIEPYVAEPPVDLFWAPFRAPRVQPILVDRTTRLPWGGGGALDKWIGYASDPTTPNDGGVIDLPWDNDQFDPIIVPPLKVYNVSNSISVVRLPERTPIHPIGLSASYDDASYCWRAQLVLFDADEAALLRPALGNQKEVEITINGFVMIFVVESRSRERQYPQKRWSFELRGRQAYLDAPYARPRALISDSLASAAQHALAELPGGWTLDWQVPDWNLPSGEWSYNGLTPIRAIARLAEAVGAVLVPDPEDQHITVRSRYPISPTLWGTTTPALVLPDALCTRLGERDRPGQTRNQVIVEGTRSPQVRVICTRAGTGGDDPLPSITEELCTHLDCGMERGRVELDATGASIDQTIAVPILPTPGVILPGQLIEVEEDGLTWRGMTRGVDITVARADRGWAIGQTVTIERREI